MGNFNRIIGQSHEAIECFRKALNLEPHNSDVLINLARHLYHLKKYRDAIFLTQKSIEYLPKSRLPWFQHFTLAEIYFTLGMDSQALEHIKYALKMKPQHVHALKLATELASKRFIENSYFVIYFCRLFKTVFIYLMHSAPSFYLQLFFHVFILVFLLLFGLIYSILNAILDEDQTTTLSFTIWRFTFTSNGLEYDLSVTQPTQNEQNKFRKIPRLHYRFRKPEAIKTKI